jgi:hypothetical protein
MADMRGNSKPNRLLVQLLCCRATPYTTTVLSAGMLRNQHPASARTVRINLVNTSGETFDIFIIKFSTTKGSLHASYFTLFRVSFAFTLSPFKCSVFDKETLPLVALASTAPFQYNSREP